MFFSIGATPYKKKIEYVSGVHGLGQLKKFSQIYQKISKIWVEPDNWVGMASKN